MTLSEAVEAESEDGRWLDRAHDSHSDRTSECLGPGGEWLGAGELPKWFAAHRPKLERLEKKHADRVDKQWAPVAAELHRFRRDAEQLEADIAAAREKLRGDPAEAIAHEVGRRVETLRSECRALGRRLERLIDEHDL